MAFWSDNTIEPLRKRSFLITIENVETSLEDDFSFLAKSTDKPTLETDVNEYRLINQIKKFPSIPRWNDITVKFIDTKDKSTSKIFYNLFFTKDKKPDEWNQTSGCPTAVSKKASTVTIIQYDSKGNEKSKWELIGAFVKSINFGDLDYSSDDLSEVEVVFAYDYAKITSS
tara:strand:- start:4372 stop:4884 length:513 start_codon:yes stop_codon:yes gene_type:complete